MWQNVKKLNMNTFVSHCIYLYVSLWFFSLGVGIDGGNGKDWESNAKSINLIKQSGKVKALDEEIHSKQRSVIIWQE